MLRHMCKSKIHRAVVTEANLSYVGSITVDADLLALADILPYEQVQVVNVNNGSRFETYVIPGAAGSGTICVNGAAARLAMPGDLVIIMAYALYGPEELAGFQPRVVHVDAANKPLA
ncbi:MAG: aspartate 1-decarboxylase [Patescibacteria group bacterium]